MMKKNNHRFEIYPILHNLNSGKNQIQWYSRYCNIKINQLVKINYCVVEADYNTPELHNIASEVLTDSVTEFLVSTNSHLNLASYLADFGFKNPALIDISFKTGVTDNAGQAMCEAFKLIPELNNKDIKVHSGQMYFIESDLTTDQLETMAYAGLANDLLHNVVVYPASEISAGLRFNNFKNQTGEIKRQPVKTIDIQQDFNELMKLNVKNCWALSETEVKQIQKHYVKLGRNPTDVEIEVIAQSWSEHCKHKIFAANIDYIEKAVPAHMKSLGSFKVESLFKTYIRGGTLKIQKDRKIDWLVSIFHDNAGIVRFDSQVDVCIKVETHNSPSALDPYGGALTGILGVNRDILGCGQGARPIANTNVFCLAEDEDFKKDHIQIHPKLKNPDRIAEGVHLGVQDGGNKSGVPTVNGAFVYDRNYVGKPLVYCGTIGVLPQIENQLSTAEKRQQVGDYIVMSGGRIGKDGIHGATFSSMELNESVPASVVQIGDPITQKRVSDFLIEAREKNLFSSVTDNGAGGLSSSIGEMAQKTNGAIVYLERAPVKYPGLAPYELMISESQERMTFAVTKEKIEQFLNLSKLRGVESTIVGEFTDSGDLQVLYKDKTVAEINLHFLHESLEPMQLTAVIDEKLIEESKNKHWLKNVTNIKIQIKKNQFDQMLLELLKSANIRSHEHLVRKYDHEVKAATLVKPFTGHKEVGFHGPTDAGVIWLKPHGGSDVAAISVACGLAPKMSSYDAYTMSIWAIDEAVRNAICVGTNPDQIVLVDNYCWPDPISSEKNFDGDYKLAQLVRASKALYDISLVYGMPFISGKDSMKNDFVFDQLKISVNPTLLITAMGKVDHIRHVTTSDLKNENDLVYVIGPCYFDNDSYLHLNEICSWAETQTDLKYADFNMQKQIQIYKKIHMAITKGFIASAHDVSEGGLAVSLAEKMMSTELGLKINLDSVSNDMIQFLFNEGPGRIVVSIKPNHKDDFEKTIGHDFIYLGEATKGAVLCIKQKSEIILSLKAMDLLKAYKNKVPSGVLV